MTSIHIQKESDPYFRIKRHSLYDKALSLQAKGLLCYFLSLKGGLIVKDVILSSNCTHDDVFSCIKELQQSGYMHYHPKKDNSIETAYYLVFEEPQKKNINTQKAFTLDDPRARLLKVVVKKS